MSYTPTEDACERALRTVVESFADVLKARCSGGSITAGDIDLAVTYFESGDLMATAVRLCARLIAESADDNIKEEAFGRILVQPFADMLDREFPHGRLRSFFETLRTIIGEDGIQSATAECAAAAERLRAARGRKFSWDDLYLEQDAIAVADWVRWQFAKAFSGGFDRRFEWLVTMLNHDIKSISTDSHAFVQIHQDGAMAAVPPPVVEKLLQMLFSDMNPTSMSTRRKDALAARFGPKALSVLIEFQGNLATSEHHSS